MGVVATAPGLLFGPGFLAEGISTAVDPSKTKMERVLGVAEAEAGLLFTGLGARKALGPLKDIKVKVEAPEIPTVPTGLGKRGMARTTQVLESEYIEIVDPKTGLKRFIKKSEFEKMYGTRTQVTGEFSRMTQEKQLEILRTAFKRQVYVGDLRQNIAFQQDLIKATRFMKESGLTPEQVKANLLRLFPQLQQESTVLVSETVGGVGQKQIQLLKPEQIVKQEQRQMQVQILGVDQKTGQVQLTRQDQLFGPAQLTKQEQLTRQQQRQRQVQLFGPAQLTKQEQLTRQQQRPAQITKTLQISTQLFKQPQITEQIIGQQIARPTTTRIVRPKPREPIRPIKLLPPTPAKEAIGKLTKELKGEFEIFARVKGKDVSIGKAKTKEKAKELLSKRLKKTIAASGFIEESGRKLSAMETGLTDGEFRTSKLDVFRIVQKKEKRLGTIPETKEIQLFKKSKGGGNLLGSFSRGKNNRFSLF